MKVRFRHERTARSSATEGLERSLIFAIRVSLVLPLAFSRMLERRQWAFDQAFRCDEIEPY